MLTESEIKAYAVDIPNDIQAARRASGCASVNGSNASLVEALKETDRHMEELYRQAGEGRIVSDGLNAARERASALTQALIQAKHLNDKLRHGGENQ